MTLAATCSVCGVAAPAGARFCPACGASLAPAPPMATERKVVTTLFADIVGFTALSEQFDPEDVDAALRGYFDMARATIERFGGIVEKYIGDAVVGAFGVPAAHEDDAERAVRAALSIVEGMRSLPSFGEQALRVRVGVNTGRALVRPFVNPGSGEGIFVGDAVNTSARLLAAAPPMSVVVGDRTHALSARLIEYEELPPFAAKGKATAVKAWIARGVIARRGVDFDHSPAKAMIDREVELGVLKGLFEKVCVSSTPQCALIVGEAGIGKSRLVHEFGAALDRRPGLMCTWRQGSCPPYGENLAFWALGEIVRAHAGILLVDPPDTVEGKLARALGSEGDSWLENRLRPLVGLSAQQTDRGENFAAWLQFFLSMAASRPTVLVFENLHWASEPTLAFLGYLATHARSAPLLVLGTARPEFVGQRPEPALDTREWTQIELRSLASEESKRLAISLLAAADLPDVKDLVVTRCGGNPLFAEEFVRYLAEDPASGGALDAQTSLNKLALATPDSIGALIAARLDALPASHKSVLADAAVVGEVFSSGAVAAISELGRHSVQPVLDQLEAREFIRRRTDSRWPGDLEFSFWHALTREVAYESLPRGARVEKHVAAATWLDAQASRQGTDVEDLLAYHYSAAHELAVLTHDEARAESTRNAALDALKLAGDHVLPADVLAARAYYERAIELCSDHDALHPHLTVALAEARMQSDELDAAIAGFRAGIDELVERGDKRAAAVAMTRLSTVIYWHDWNDAPLAQQLRSRALTLLAEDGPSLELATVLEECAVQASRDFDGPEAVRLAGEAVRMCAELGLPEPIRAIAYRGSSLCDVGDETGLDDMRRAWDMAVVRGNGLEADIACQLLAEAIYAYEGADAGLRIATRGYDDAVRREERLTASWFKLQQVQFLRLGGEWQAARTEGAQLEHDLEGSGRTLEFELSWEMAQIELLHGDVAAAAKRVERSFLVRPPNDSYHIPVIGVMAAVRLAQGEPTATLELLGLAKELSLGREGVSQLALQLPLLARTAVTVGAEDLIVGILALLKRERPVDRCTLATISALAAARDGNLAAAERLCQEAADAWTTFGNPWEAAQLLHDRGRSLVVLGRTVDAVGPLAEARAVFAHLGAPTALAEVESLLRDVRP